MLPALHCRMPAKPAFLAPVLLAAFLAGCGGVSETVAPEVSAPAVGARTAAKYPVEKLVGSWGIASFREEKDRKRVEAQARAQCKLPYVIRKGPTDGVMMHAADDPKLYELTLKGSAGGRTFLGFESPPGDETDREILSFDDNMIVMRFVGEDIHARYGTFIYVRCGAR